MAVSMHVGSWLSHPVLGVSLSLLGAAALCLVAFGKRSRIPPQVGRATDVSPGSFARLLESHGFDPAVALVTYCYLHDMQGRQFPILPGDRLDRDLGLSPAEVEQTMLAVMALLGKKPALGWHRYPVATVEDLIGVLQGSPKQVSAVAA